MNQLVKPIDSDNNVKMLMFSINQILREYRKLYYQDSVAFKILFMFPLDTFVTANVDVVRICFTSLSLETLVKCV